MSAETTDAEIRQWAIEIAHTTVATFEAAEAEVQATLSGTNLTLRELQRLVRRNGPDVITTLRLLRSGASVHCLDLRLQPLCRIYPSTLRRCAQLTGATR